MDGDEKMTDLIDPIGEKDRLTEDYLQKPGCGGTSEEKEHFSAVAPYPPVMVEEENLHYAQLLAVNLASPKSELTSVLQYIYQDWFFTPQYKEVARIIKKIAIVEMHHMDILGRLIVLLDGNPTYCAVTDNRFHIWNGNMVTYSNMVCLALTDNICLEEAAIASYKEHAAQINDHYIVDVLNRIIEDEQVHLQIFHKMLNDLNAVK